MGSPTDELLNPKSLVIPKMTETIRDLLVAEEGTLIYNVTTNKLNICDVSRTAGSSSWAVVTSS